MATILFQKEQCAWVPSASTWQKPKWDPATQKWHYPRPQKWCSPSQHTLVRPEGFKQELGVDVFPIWEPDRAAASNDIPLLKSSDKDSWGSVRLDKRVGRSARVASAIPPRCWSASVSNILLLTRREEFMCRVDVGSKCWRELASSLSALTPESQTGKGQRCRHPTATRNRKVC